MEIRRHKKWITEYKQERADLAAGLITEKDLHYEDVPDFCNTEIFKPDEFLEKDYTVFYESVEKLPTNISELENAIAVLKHSDNEEYHKRAEKMIDCLNRAKEVLTKYKAILEGDAQITAKEISANCKVILEGDGAETTQQKISTCKYSGGYLIKHIEQAEYEGGNNKIDSLRKWINEVAEDNFKPTATFR